MNSFISTLIEQRLSELLPLPQGPQAILVEAARYAVLNGGKRVRPRLLLAAVETLHGDPLLALDVACAIEFMHNYSLIHDDLPCMDNDDWRRGNPSVHRAYSEEIAILAGNYLLTTTFKILSQIRELSSEQKIKLISLFSEASSEEGLLGGQILDLHPDLARSQPLSTLYEMKTGALFSACLEAGAILCFSPASQQCALKKLGLLFGIAFQIEDDLEDFSTFSKSTNVLHSLSQAESRTSLQNIQIKIQEILNAECWKESPLEILCFFYLHPKEKPSTIAP